MKLKNKLKFALLLALFLIATLLALPHISEDITRSISKYFQPQQEETLNKTFETTSTIQQKLNQTNESGARESPEPASKPGKEAEKALTLGLIDICSGKLDLLKVSEGITHCLNKKSPYYIIIEKNSTHLTTSLQGENFSEIYELNDSVLIFYIFAEDVASVSHEIQSFTLEGSPEFHLGEYYLHTIWEKDSSNNLTISKIIVALSLYVDGNITTSNEWKELKLYLNVPNKTYYLGNLWVLVK